MGSSALALLLISPAARAAIIKGGLPWKPGSADPPTAVTPGGWHYFTPQEAKTVEAFVDRLIPPDELSPGGKETGCAVFIDRQLAGSLWPVRGPLHERAFPAGDQAARSAIAGHAGSALSQGVGGVRRRLPWKFGGKGFADLTDDAERRGDQGP